MHPPISTFDYNENGCELSQSFFNSIVHQKQEEDAAIYEVTPTPNISKIFEGIDASAKRMPKVSQSFKIYTKKMDEFIRRNSQPYHETKMRLKIHKLLREAIEPYFNNGYLALGGSTLNKICSPGADLDLCFAIKSFEGVYDEEYASEILTKIRYILEEKPFVANVRYISARVPILKIDLEFPFQGVEIDMNCNCVAGIYNSHLINRFSRIDERFVQMNIILKEWGKVYDVISPRHGKINSYTMTLMIVHFLQCGVYPPILPNLYKLYPAYFGGTANIEELNYEELLPPLPRINRNMRTIGELVYGFLEYYSRFDYRNWWISIKEGRIFSRSNQPESDRQFLFYLEEAYDGMTVPKNLIKPHKLSEIVKTFQEERLVILNDLFGNYQPPPIDTSYDFVPEEENRQHLVNGFVHR